MQQAIVLRSPLLPSKYSLLPDPILYPKTPFQCIAIERNSPSPTPSFLISHKTQIQKWAICAKKSRRSYGSRKPMKFILELISLLGLNPQLLPPPLGPLMEELIHGDGGRSGILLSFVGGIFDLLKRKRKRKVNLGFWISLGLFSLSLLPGKMLKPEVISGILGFGLLSKFLIKKWRKWLQNWVFGLCCFAFLIAQVYKGEDAIKLGKEIRVSSSMAEIVRGSRRKGGRGRGRAF